jgi:hypothetical protein
MSISSQMQNQNAAVTYRRLCNSATGAGSLNEGEIRALKVYCFALVGKWSNEVARTLKRGRFRDARGTQTRLFESLAARLVAAWQADTKFRKRRRRQLRAQGLACNLHRQSLVDLLQLAERLKNVHAPASVVTKPASSFRAWGV